uniref:Uncharacterized protein n=1 Tax=Anguilla anguilla TaxID=7936 RepID=A0A0E9TCG2_ANGAN
MKKNGFGYFMGGFVIKASLFFWNKM